MQSSELPSIPPPHATFSQEPPRPPAWKKALAPIGIALVLLLKFGAKLKFLIVPVMKFLPAILKTGSTMILTMWLYAQMWGWMYAAGFVLLIFVHEGGHLIAARRMGLSVGAPVFIPFMGALIALKDAPKNAWIEAVVGIGGPVAGTLGAMACHWGYLAWDAPLLGALAYTGYFLNLFNLTPISPLDGGRIATAISPWLWAPGLGILVWMMFQSPMSPVLFFVLIAAIPRVISLFRHRNDEEARYFELSSRQRIEMAAWYFGLAVFLFFAMNHVIEDLQATGHWRQGS